MGTPQYRYKAEGGVVIDQVFDSEEEWAEGWEDSPAKCKGEKKSPAPSPHAHGHSGTTMTPSPHAHGHSGTTSPHKEKAGTKKSGAKRK